MHINQLKDSKYLKKEDCEPPILVTIEGDAEQVNIAMEGQPEELKWAIHFREEGLKPMILNSTNAELISRAVGSPQTEDWDGKQIVLYHDPNISFAGKLVGGIRVRAARPGTKVTEATKQLAATVDEDDIPF